ncbi:MAG TPA: hypothetical protein VGK54_11380, partial [Chloroflexota bacterium]
MVRLYARAAQRSAPAAASPGYFRRLRNSLRDSFIVVPTFTRGRPGPYRVSIDAGEGGIAHDSVLFCDEVTTLSDEFLADGPLGPRVPAALLG